jgi:DNA-binding NarL/FixJ family response regulator
MNEQNKYKILIADDHAIMRAGLAALLSSQDDFEIVGQVDNGRDAINCIGKIKPHLVIMDLSMPHTNGTEAIEYIKKRFPQTKILALTMHRNEQYVHVTLKAGANGYVLKDDTNSELFVAIRSVLKGKTYISPTVSDKVVSAFLNSKPRPNSQELNWNTRSDHE